MDIIKVIITALVACSILTACGDSDRTEKEALQKEVAQLRIERNQMTEQTAKAQKLIDEIWAELNTVSGRAFELERKKESNSRTQNLKKADEIAKDIAEIKKKLNDAEEEEGLNQTMRSTIVNLRNTVLQKEEEIKQLKKTIRNLKKDNTDLTLQLQKQNAELIQKNNDLIDSNRKLTNTKIQLQTNNIAAWIKVGDELLNSVRKIGPKKGNGNMKEIKNAQIDMILRAIDCYQKAYDLGGRNEVETKLNRTRRGYQIYLNSDTLII